MCSERGRTHLLQAAPRSSGSAGGLDHKRGPCQPPPPREAGRVNGGILCHNDRLDTQPGSARRFDGLRVCKRE